MSGWCMWFVELFSPFLKTQASLPLLGLPPTYDMIIDSVASMLFGEAHWPPVELALIVHLAGRDIMVPII